MGGKTKKKDELVVRLSDKQIKRLIRLADDLAESLYELEGARLANIPASLRFLMKLRDKYLDFRAEYPAGELDPWK